MTRVVSVDVTGSVACVVLSAGGVAVAMVGTNDTPVPLGEELPFVGLVEDAVVGVLLAILFVADMPTLVLGLLDLCDKTCAIEGSTDEETYPDDQECQTLTEAHGLEHAYLTEETVDDAVRGDEQYAQAEQGGDEQVRLVGIEELPEGGVALVNHHVRHCHHGYQTHDSCQQRDGKSNAYRIDGPTDECAHDEEEASQATHVPFVGTLCRLRLTDLIGQVLGIHLFALHSESVLRCLGYRHEYAQDEVEDDETSIDADAPMPT